ncbi:MAG: hypothetical protein JKZ02_00855 [Erythrobacter sp.]|nr:hypothetical protein [Erythrobacter sp.]
MTNAAFVVPPLLAGPNLVETRCEMNEDARPRAGIKELNVTGAAAMSALAVMYFVLV